jgi:hypothetical protein
MNPFTKIEMLEAELEIVRRELGLWMPQISVRRRGFDRYYTISLRVPAIVYASRNRDVLIDKTVEHIRKKMQEAIYV